MQLPSFHIYQEERMFILQIFDNVFPASVIPNPFKNAIRTPPFPHQSLELNGSIHSALETLFLYWPHLSLAVWRAEENQELCNGSFRAGGRILNSDLGLRPWQHVLQDLCGLARFIHKGPRSSVVGSVVVLNCCHGLTINLVTQMQ